MTPARATGSFRELRKVIQTSEHAFPCLPRNLSVVKCFIDGTQCLFQVQKQPRASRRAAREAHKVLEQLASAEDMSESEPERAPRVHWRKRAAAARRGGRGPARKPVHKASSRPAASKRKREASSPPLATHPVPPPLQLRLPSPVEEPRIVQPRVVSAQSATKLRTHHHEFLSEYSKVRFRCRSL